MPERQYISAEHFMCKEITCEIDGEECNEFENCSRCQKALDYTDPIKIEREDIEANIHNFCEITHNGNVMGHKCLVDNTNVLAVMENVSASDIAAKYDANYQELSLEIEVPGLNRLYPNWRLLKIYNALPTPDTIFYAHNWPLILQYPDKVYLIAPRLEDL